MPYVRLEHALKKYCAVTGLRAILADQGQNDWPEKDEEKILANYKAWIDQALLARQSGRDYAFVILDQASGRIAGSTRFREIDAVNRSLEIGGTWLGKDFRGTAINRNAKFLLLQFAFESLGVIRVQFRTDLRNVRSQSAIIKIGALREGVFRKDFIYDDGYQRSTVFYSITDEDWPRVRELFVSGLQSR